ncbi:MAG: Ribose import ATP-binding protein RbsA [Firmicutes bacterium ADurb.Bin182]|nr:MAG: Ribose import ATP-binding protein RbsA [Firmicutes bacterium ADurb.Bin182]
MSEYLLELSGISKSFPGVKALDNVDFQLKRGEIHAIMGENGAGKSTFIKVIMGVHHAEEGSMYLEGKKVAFKTPLDAQKAGIAAIYQHVTSYPHLSVTENIFIGHEEVKNGFIQWKQMNKYADALLKQLNAEFSATALMGSLSVAQQQMVEIAKALSMNARIIIMDEPTAALTKSESEELYRIAEKLRDDGKSIIFISHRLEDMYRLASRVTVLRDSRCIGTYNVNEITPPELIKAMVGREIKELFPKPKVEIGAEVLRAENLSRVGYFKNVSFHVNRGEIVGFTGLVGAGRTEVMQTIYGAERYNEGKLFIEGKQVHIRGPRDALEKGIGLLTEDRQTQGLILDWSIGRNITLSELKKHAKHSILNEEKENETAKRLSESVDVKTVSIFDKVSSLSGGNQQKVVVAKSLGTELKVLIMDEPTKGVDVGAKAAIYEIMGELAGQGLAIVMISSEMPEILGMCDRIYVMCEGRITGELSRADLNQEKILALAMTKHNVKAANA